jgi:VanZ family protein
MLDHPVFKKVCMGSTVLLATMVLILSWVRNPDIGTLQPLESISPWINHFGNLRTMIPFLALGGVVELALIKNTKERALFTLLLFVLILLAEGGQILIPTRHPDLLDVLFAMIGAFGGLVAGNRLKKVIRKKCQSEEPTPCDL